ncbi:unnamed protein product [Linum trigynum]|uniref:Uncharacterized protein n=1 Tax=Linum trigynum TaxID=586398 RepID=A0AAV2DE53_9ROSI
MLRERRQQESGGSRRHHKYKSNEHIALPPKSRWRFASVILICIGTASGHSLILSAPFTTTKTTGEELVSPTPKMGETWKPKTTIPIIEKAKVTQCPLS